jgi:hypothetical protein
MTDREPPDQPPTRDDGQDTPSRAHTPLGEEHPAGEEPRSDRDVGGPTGDPDAEPSEGGAPGTPPDSGFEPHE